MKKYSLFVIALILLPALCLAGTVSSRWDVTIGGYVKGEIGYSDEGRAQSYVVPQRESGTTENIGAKFGNFWGSAVQTRLNFLIKGPDAFGMKTSAFIEGDFYAQSGSNQGGLRLRHGFVRLTGPQATVTIGQFWQLYGLPFGSGNLINWGDVGPIAGTRVPQINLDFNATKTVTLTLGVFQNTNPIGFSGTGAVDGFTRGGPFFQGQILYASDVCGKIGPNMLSFKVNGFYGREKRTFMVGTSADSESINSWGIFASFLVPIIPEKGGKKDGALGFAAAGMISQNPGYIGDPFMTGSGSYARTGNKYAANVLSGGKFEAWYYFTDQYSLTVFYGWEKQNMSNRFATANPDAVKNAKEFVLSLCYDPNPAMKFGIEWEHNRAKFAAPRSGYKDEGKSNTYRFAAFYFF
jgi:hypothetical protein